MSGVGAQRGGHVHEAICYGLFGRKKDREVYFHLPLATARFKVPGLQFSLHGSVSWKR